MRKIIRIAILLFSVSMLSGCDFEGGDSPYVLPHVLFIKFTNSNGDILSDSLGVFKSSIYCTGEAIERNTKIDITSDYYGKQTFGYEAAWEEFTIGNLRQYFPHLCRNNITRLLTITIRDSNIWFKASKAYNEIYNIDLVCPPVFGDNETHKIRLYNHIYKSGVYAIYKLELDGEDLTVPEMFHNKKYPIEDGYKTNMIGV